MPRRYIRTLAPLIIAVFALMVCQPAECRAQQAPAALPQGWQQMSAPDFAAAIRPLCYSKTFDSLSPSDQQAARDYGEKLFGQVDISSTSLSYQTLEMLHWVARYQYDESVLNQTRSALLARKDDWTGKPYAEVRAKVVMMMRLKVPDTIIVAEARRWVTAGGTLAQVPKEDLKYDIVRQAFAPVRVVDGSFSVEWNGQITAPANGDYTFFISPINVTSGDPGAPVRFSASVSVGGQVILNATPTTWTDHSSVVSLTAGQSVALQVKVAANVVKIPPGTMHAMLYWQGPAFSKSLVPQANLMLPDGSGSGLQGTYAWTEKGQPQVLTRTDAQIDFSWTSPIMLLALDPASYSQITSTMFTNATSQDFIAWCVTSGSKVKLHPFLADAEGASPGLSSSQRQSFSELLLGTQMLLGAADAKHIVDFYGSFRMGASDRTLDVFGAWAAQQADLTPAISANSPFDEDNRRAFRQMAILVTQQQPEQAIRLQQQYLQLPDGRCCLPVAYTLAYSTLGSGKLADWTAQLDARLASQSLTGDLRVNWLLARAHAEEIRLAEPNPYMNLSSRPMDGKAYLNQAFQSAASGPAKLRVLQEMVARLASTQQFPVAKSMLQQLTSSLPADQQAVAAAWPQQLDTLAAGQAQLQQTEAVRAKQAYLASLQERRAQAAAKGDAGAVSRYDALINAAQSNP